MATSKKLRRAAAGKKPKQTFVAIGQEALKAQQLAVNHASTLGERLPAAFMTAFNADLVALPADVPGAMVSKHGAVQSTAAQNAALAIGHNLVLGVHTAVRSQTTNKDLRLAYTVGTKMRVLVKDVKAALQTIVARATSHPAEAATFGIIPGDITAFNAALTAIETADAAQEAARAAAPTTTQARNATAKRLLAGIKFIAAAGMRVYANDPVNYALFAALS